jgi:NAD(P)-dependent dehydrogenase (short-subunit alcohol dehydrogenase family)
MLEQKTQLRLAGANMLLDGKTAIVTGAGSGIGRGCAIAFAREGASLALIDLNIEAVKQTAAYIKTLGRETIFSAIDVTNEQAVEGAVAEAVSRFGRLDILNSNAGIAVRNPVTEQDETSWDRCMAVNVKGVFLCAKYVIPHMRAAGGSIINMSSITGIVGVRNRSAYAASKGAIVSLTRNMALDYAHFQIRVNCVCPGFTRTPLIEKLLEDTEKQDRLVGMHPLGRLGTVEDIANAVLFFASDQAAWITGQALAVDGGFGVGAHEDV